MIVDVLILLVVIIKILTMPGFDLDYEHDSMVLKALLLWCALLLLSSCLAEGSCKVTVLGWTMALLFVCHLLLALVVQQLARGLGGCLSLGLWLSFD